MAGRAHVPAVSREGARPIGGARASLRCAARACRQACAMAKAKTEGALAGRQPTHRVQSDKVRRHGRHRALRRRRPSVPSRLSPCRAVTWPRAELRRALQGQRCIQLRFLATDRSPRAASPLCQQGASGSPLVPARRLWFPSATRWRPPSPPSLKEGWLREEAGSHLNLFESHRTCCGRASAVNVSIPGAFTQILGTFRSCSPALPCRSCWDGRGPTHWRRETRRLQRLVSRAPPNRRSLLCGPARATPPSAAACTGPPTTADAANARDDPRRGQELGWQQNPRGARS
jgi:hypothetical protein